MKENTSFWRYVATSAVSVLITGVIAWFSFGQQTMTKQEIVELVGIRLATVEQISAANTTAITATAEAVRLNAETLQAVKELLARHDERIKYMERTNR